MHNFRNKLNAMPVGITRKISRLKNHFSSEARRQFLKKIKSPVMPKPNFVAIEATPNCNARCFFCDMNWQKKNAPSGYMNKEVFGKILPILTRETSVVFSSSGECFLHKEYCDMLHTIKNRAKDVTAITNGRALDAKLIHNLIDYGLDELRVSIHAATDATYQKIYGSDGLSEVIKNLKALKRIKAEKGVKSPRVIVNIIGMQENVDEIPGIVKLAGEAGVDHVQLFHLIVADESIKRQSLFYDQDRALRKYEEAKEVAGKAGITITLPSYSETKSGCYMDFFNHLYITWDGIALSCCMERHYYGDLKKDPIKTIWNGRNIRQLRKSCYQKGVEAVCPGCPTWDKRMESIVHFNYSSERVRV